MRWYLVSLVALSMLVSPVNAQLTSQQQRMKDCNRKRAG